MRCAVSSPARCKSSVELTRSVNISVTVPACIIVAPARGQLIVSPLRSSHQAVGSYSLVFQVLEQRLRVLQVGGVEALGEPVVDFGQHRARLVALALLVEEPREAHICFQSA